MESVQLIVTQVLMVLAALAVPIVVWLMVVAGLVQLVRDKVREERRLTHSRVLREEELPAADRCGPA